jgi:hypothetical protein
LALLHDAELLHAGIQVGVVNGEASVGGQLLNQLLVGGRKLVAATFVGQVEIAEPFTLFAR